MNSKHQNIAIQSSCKYYKGFREGKIPWLNSANGKSCSLIRLITHRAIGSSWEKCQKRAACIWPGASFIGFTKGTEPQGKSFTKFSSLGDDPDSENEHV